MVFPAGTGIYVSIVLRPKFPPDKAPGLSLATALALADTLSSYCPGEIKIKWPNDVLLAGRKVAGILTELSAERNEINHVIVGVGINVNHSQTDFPEEIRKQAISLRLVTRKLVNRAELLRDFLARFEREYAKFKKSGLKPSRRRLREYSSMLNQPVKLTSGTHILEGTAVDIDADGSLVLLSGNHQLRIAAGEVTVIGH